MAASVQLLPDGSVVVTDGGASHAPLSPEAVQAIAGLAAASANASKTQQMTELLTGLATLITAAAPAAGTSAYAQVTVTPGAAAAVLDQTSFDLVKQNMTDGAADNAGNWVVGPLKVSPKAPDPTPPPAGGTV